MSKSRTKADREPSGVPPVPVTKGNLEEVVRVIKTGLAHHHILSEETRKDLTDWMEEMEDDIDVEEGRNPDERKSTAGGEAVAVLPSPEENPSAMELQDSVPPVEPFQLDSTGAGSMEAAAARLQEKVTNPTF